MCPAEISYFHFWSCKFRIPVVAAVCWMSLRLRVGSASSPPARGRARSCVCGLTAAGAAHDGAKTTMQDALERASKLRVEDGVDDRIEEAVDVAEPDEEREEPRVDVA